MSTIVLHIAGLLQSWGCSGSKLSYRDTEPYPTKSGIVGMLCEATNDRSDENIHRFASLAMAVRVDSAGTICSDYHTVNFANGFIQADGGIKKGTVITRRNYLQNAYFVVALSGCKDTLEAAATALREPACPLFLGRKTCMPSVPVLKAVYDDLDDPIAVLAKEPIFVKPSYDVIQNKKSQRLDVYADKHLAPEGFVTARCDHPISISPVMRYRNRLVSKMYLVMDFHENLYQSLSFDAMTSPKPTVIDKQAKKARKEYDNYKCCFCKESGDDIHHVTYRRYGKETNDDLRFLCRLHHEAVSMIECGMGMGLDRVDPLDPKWRDEIISVSNKIINETPPVKKNERIW